MFVLCCVALLHIALGDKDTGNEDPSGTTITLPIHQLVERQQKAAFYQHMREEYPHLLATSSTSGDGAGAGDTIAVTVDTSLHHLISLGLPAHDLRQLYAFFKAGPQHSLAEQGLLIGADLSRESRTLVYRALVDVARRLDSKTRDYKGVSEVFGTPYGRKMCACVSVYALEACVCVYA